MAGGFILKYGSFAHAIGEVGIQIARTFSYDEKQEKSLRTETWTLDARLKGTDVADMKTKIEALVAAYSINRQDLILFDGDGVTRTAHALISANSRDGTRVLSTDFPESEGPEHVTFRNYRIVVEAEFEIAGRPELLIFHESVTSSGGLPRHVWQESLTGVPVKQTVVEKTVFKATQSGMAVGNFRFPAIPSPLFPDDLDEEVQITKDGPREVSTGKFREFQISWVYTFTDEAKLLPEPNTAPR